MKNRYYIQRFALVVLAIEATSAQAALPREAPIRIKNLSQQDRQTLNAPLRENFAAMETDVRVRFEDLVQQLSKMGFKKDGISERSVVLNGRWSK